MPISLEETRRIAGLARLSLTTEEAAGHRDQFGRILELMGELSTLDDAAAEAAAAPPAANVLREDEPHPFAEPEALLALAPEHQDGYYRARKVLG